MAINPISLGLTFDLTQVDSVTKSQRWILSAMQRHGSTLVTVLWRILGNEEDVCDAYQETFLRLAHQPNQEKPKKVRAYLFKTASNIAISMLRQRQRQRKYCQSLAESYTSAEHSPVAELDSMYLQQRLREAITELPDYLADVIVLRELAQMSYSEVAENLGIQAAAARVYRHKAIKILAVLMLQTENEKSNDDE